MIPGSESSPGEGIGYLLQYSWASLVAQIVKNTSAMWETLVRSLGWEDPLEEGRATHSIILARRIPMDRALMGYSPGGCKESDTTEQLRHQIKTIEHFMSHILFSFHNYAIHNSML